MSAAVCTVTPNLALGAFPGFSVAQAMQAAQPLADAGVIRLDHVQICPQNAGTLDVESARALAAAYPNTQFRLHANARVAGWTSLADLSTLNRHMDYYVELGKVSRALGAGAYTVHAGLRRNATLYDLERNLDVLSDIMGCDVGIEGMYPRGPHPVGDEHYLVATWEEYAALADNRMPYALDLSHLQILAHKTGCWDEGLVRDLLANPLCLEIHISGNDGQHDQHRSLTGDEGWLCLLEHANKRAVIFTEENRRAPASSAQDA